jgi:hypothetical protein
LKKIPAFDGTERDDIFLLRHGNQIATSSPRNPSIYL